MNETEEEYEARKDAEAGVVVAGFLLYGAATLICWAGLLIYAIYWVLSWRSSKGARTAVPRPPSTSRSLSAQSTAGSWTG